MGNCDSSLERLRNHNSKLLLSQENTYFSTYSNSSSSLPQISSKNFAKNENIHQTLKKNIIQLKKLIHYKISNISYLKELQKGKILQKNTIFQKKF